MSEQVQIAEGFTWGLVIARGARALLGAQLKREVVVIGWDYLPEGMMYSIENPDIEEWVHFSLVTPMPGRTTYALVNLMDGGEEPLGVALPWYADRVAGWFHRPVEV